ncbi:hypothetical protein NFH98_20775 [Halomonas sp. H33-56]|uniref:head-tail joining protein n=1 Tax=Halomonas sp. H33-56 TaxID=2950873 RepID=UPI0032DFC821
MAWEDIAVRAQRRILRKLGEDVIYIPSGGEAVTVRGLFEEQHQSVDPDTGVPVYSVNPTLTVVLADLPDGSPGMGDRMTRKARTYRVVGSQPDDNGGTLLELKT